MPKVDGKAIYESIKTNSTKYKEEKHCAMILNVMSDTKKGTMSAFCIEAFITDRTFYNWLEENEIFLDCYGMARMFARENWERQGRKFKTKTLARGETNYEFEYWKMIGWSRFGVGKNSKIRLKLKHDSPPNEHYAQLIKQASDGDFTAGELKQLMEAVNVGLNTHQVFELQKEIDQLKSDLAIMNENANGNNTFTDKGFTKKD